MRGSTPTPEPRNSRYGGNTCCLEVRLANDRLIILDCGSGLRGLGKSLLGEYGERPMEASVFLTHFHWDHIQGIPFFLPLYRPGNIFQFHSVLRKGSRLKDTIEGQMANPYFPVNMEVMSAQRQFLHLDKTPIRVDGAKLSWAPLNHPQGCVGYRIEADDSVFVLATDTEPGSPVHDRSLRKLARNADVLVYDAQYTPEQLAGEKKGWGHSSWQEGVRIAQECHVKHLVLFHHDPDSDDAYVDALVIRARQEFANVWGANEGLTILLPDGAITNPMKISGAERRVNRRYPLEVPVRVKWREAGGQIRQAEGMAKDISRKGIFFMAPTEILAQEPLQLELVLPDKMRRQGHRKIKVVARTLRQEKVGGNDGHPPSGVAVAAALDPPSTPSRVLPGQDRRR